MSSLTEPHLPPISVVDYGLSEPLTQDHVDVYEPEPLFSHRSRTASLADRSSRIFTGGADRETVISCSVLALLVLLLLVVFGLTIGVSVWFCAQPNKNKNTYCGSFD
jgi:hypothetical protein